MSRKTLPDEPLRLPVKLGPVSNGEFVPEPSSPLLREVERRSFARAFEGARRTGQSRREFLASSSAVAGVLISMNELLGCSAGRYNVPPEAALEPASADATLAGNEFIFDVQTHRVSTTRDWPQKNWQFKALAARAPQGQCGDADVRQCYSSDRYIRSVFLESDTQIAVLSALPGAEDANPLHLEEAAETRETLQKMAGSRRLLLQAIVQPNTGPIKAELERMQLLHEKFKVAAWKLYTVWGEDGKGYFLDDPKTGIRVIEQARALKVPIIAVHKGLPQPGMDPLYTRPRDIGPVAKRFPDVKFLVYHSAFEHDKKEAAYNSQATRGVDALIRSLEENGIGPDGNVYAEMGAVWQTLMKRPDEAAHFLGKLLKHLGEDRILWGTDSIWYGSPQDQIQAFRAFEILPEFREPFGYPLLTPQAKRKILGLNAATLYGVSVEATRAELENDGFTRMKAEYRARHWPSFETNGPTTRRELFDVLRAEGKLPGSS